MKTAQDPAPSASDGDVASIIINVRADGTIQVTPTNLGFAGAMKLMAEALSMMLARLRPQNAAAPETGPPEPIMSALNDGG
jgi:hypothetical protein